MKDFYRVFVGLGRRGFFNWMPDKLYLNIAALTKFGEKINFNNPVTFNEKMQWLKVYNRKKEYIQMVDKYEAKRYVDSRIGKEYIIPTIGVYNFFNEINFDKLPSQFVIKCTHDSGSIVIVNDKSKFDVKKAKKIINKGLRNNGYNFGREWPYKNVKPRIIIEKFLSNNGNDIQDYKIHCFNGKAKVILVCKDRFSSSGLTEDFFDTSWNHLDIKRPNHGNSFEPIERPTQLNKMIELAEKLSNSIPFLRVDFYEVGQKIYFGEMTFYPASGFAKFIPEEWDEKLGSWIILPAKEENIYANNNRCRFSAN